MYCKLKKKFYKTKHCHNIIHIQNMKYEDILKNILVRCFSIKMEHKTNIFMYRFFSSVNKWTK